MKDVDKFIENPAYSSGSMEEQTGEVYARWFFLLHRLPASLYYDFNHEISKYMLFCDHEGRRYRVTGASRMGDIWLAKDHGRQYGYDLRVCYSSCSNWSGKP